MGEVIFIVGLPGCGKTTLINYYMTHPFKDYSVYDDFMEWVRNDSLDKKKFNSSVKYKDLLKDIKEGKNVIVTDIKFCNHEFLIEAEYDLKLIFPGIKIEKIYFEKNLEYCINNIKYRDKKNGGYWKENEKGEMWYYGNIIHGIPFYKYTIEKAKSFNEEYIIPDNVIPYKVKNIDEDNT